MTEQYNPNADTVTLTDSAIKYFADTQANKLVKFGITGGGCSGFSYRWESYDAYENHMANDLVLKYKDFTLYVDGFSLQYLAGSEVDYVTGISGSNIVINSPLASGSCGCGESVAF
jgi:iron-sulfur cluster assembly accessory protein